MMVVVFVCLLAFVISRHSGSFPKHSDDTLDITVYVVLTNPYTLDDIEVQIETTIILNGHVFFTYSCASVLEFQ